MNKKPKLKYHHIGIPTEKTMEGEAYIKDYKIYHCGFDKSEYGIEWMRYEKDCPLPEIVKTIPHVAFEVKDIHEAIKGKKVIIEPNSPSEGNLVAFIEENGAPIELIQTNIRNEKHRKNIEPFEKIIQLLESGGIRYVIREHEPVYTSEQAARIGGESLSEGAKSLLLKADDDFILAVLPGDRRLSAKKVKVFLKKKKIRFARPEEVRRIMSCEIGACYPLGNIIGVRTVVDSSFSEDGDICFNPGVHNKTIRMKYRDYMSIALDAAMADISGNS